MKRLLWIALLAASCGDSNYMADMSSAVLPIGNPCAPDGPASTACGPFPRYFCDWSCGHSNGYCKANCVKDGDCPAGSVCATSPTTAQGECHKKCSTSADCRASEGYVCKTGTGDMGPGDATSAHCAAPAMRCDGGT